ncbi:MAG: alpha/beta hydrolase [Flavobacteriaceae bacterium]
MKSKNKGKPLWYRALISLLVLLLLLGVLGYYSDIPVEELQKNYADNASQFAKFENGFKVHYKDEGKGMPIVLVHGTASSLHTWDAWANELKKEYRVIRMDIPGFGLTGPNPERDYSIKKYTQFLDEFLTKIEIDSMYLVGNSLGGNIAWNYTAEHLSKVKKLVLVDASGIPTGKEQPWIFKLAKTPILNKLFLGITPKFIIRKNLEQVYVDHHKITDELITRYHQLALREGNRQAFIDRANIDFKKGDTLRLSKIKTIETKTLVLWGEKDTWIPLDNAHKFMKLLPNAELTVLKETGHVPMEENPIVSLQKTLVFLKK